MSEKDEIIANLRKSLPELWQRWPIRSLALFGSMIRGEARPDSDVDILGEFEKPIGLFSFLELEEELEKLVRRQVALVSKPALKPVMSEQILAEALSL